MAYPCCGRGLQMPLDNPAKPISDSTLGERFASTAVGGALMPPTNEKRPGQLQADRAHLWRPVKGQLQPRRMFPASSKKARAPNKISKKYGKSHFRFRARSDATKNPYVWGAISRRVAPAQHGTTNCWSSRGNTLRKSR